MDELYQGLERTASELAELTGLSPSAMSYHLRALERWGVVVRGEPREDARERPWRAAARSLSMSSDAVSRRVADVLTAEYLEQLRSAFDSWTMAEGRETEGWRSVGRFRRSFLWLTEAEALALSAELDATVEKHVGDRDAAHHPEGTRRVLLVLATVPEVPER